MNASSAAPISAALLALFGSIGAPSAAAAQVEAQARYKAFAHWYLGEGSVTSVRVRATQRPYDILITAERNRYIMAYYQSGKAHSKLIWDGEHGFVVRDSARQTPSDCALIQFVSEVKWLTGEFINDAVPATTGTGDSVASLTLPAASGRMAVAFEPSGAPSAVTFECDGNTGHFRALRYARVGDRTIIQAYTRGDGPPVEVISMRFNTRIYPGEFDP